MAESFRRHTKYGAHHQQVKLSEDLDDFINYTIEDLDHAGSFNYCWYVNGNWYLRNLGYARIGWLDRMFNFSVRPTTILLVHLSPTIRAGCLLTVPVPIIAGFRPQRSPHQEPTLLRVPALGASVAQPAGHMALRLRPHRQTRTRGENVKKHIYIADVSHSTCSIWCLICDRGTYEGGLGWRLLRCRGQCKVCLSMAFTITMLSSGVIEYHQQMVDAGKLRHALEAINRGTYYFIKAHTHPKVLWVQVLTFLLVFPLTYLRSPTQKLYSGETRNDQVGDGDTDHYCWQRPEDMTV
ncbi:hypothetical protein SAY87_009244 [Trapa incisa]|uniref:cellulase n=1 Tax=Trapa incisa TaxID=236973 RepID=A0AAN7JYF6_9MYRT|nr:hypothetical protein SAY87_009244 [Trapa incisa]